MSRGARALRPKTIAEAAETIGLWRSREHRVVAVSGYWNPLHLAHIQYIEAAAGLGAKLVVIVNTDHQVALKGSVPFMTEGDRLELVSALWCVDQAVLAIDEDRSVCRTLELLHPDVFANGGDVGSESDCRETDICRKLGIEMKFGVGGRDKLRSSSELIRRARLT
jgi:cytidyltransferase-like protein